MKAPYGEVRLLTTTELACRLKVHVQTARRYCRDGIIETVDLGQREGPGKRYRIPEYAVGVFLQRHS